MPRVLCYVASQNIFWTIDEELRNYYICYMVIVIASNVYANENKKQRGQNSMEWLILNYSVYFYMWQKAQIRNLPSGG